MHRVRRSVFVRSFLLPFALLLWLAACQKYVMVQPPLERSLAEEKPTKVRVTLAEGGSVFIAHPRIEADSLVGLDADSWDGRRKVYTNSVRIALDDVYSVEAKKADSGKTVLLVFGIIGGVILVGSVLYAATDTGYGECFPFGCE